MVEWTVGLTAAYLAESLVVVWERMMAGKTAEWKAASMAASWVVYLVDSSAKRHKRLLLTT